MENNDKQGFDFEIVKHIGIYEEPKKENGWIGEVNIVVWYGGEPKVDIRRWNKDHTKCSKGVTLTEADARLLGMVLYNI